MGQRCTSKEKQSWRLLWAMVTLFPVGVGGGEGGGGLDRISGREMRPGRPKSDSVLRHESRIFLPCLRQNADF